MDNFMIGLQNFIFRNYKRPLIKESGEYKKMKFMLKDWKRNTPTCAYFVI